MKKIVVLSLLLIFIFSLSAQNDFFSLCMSGTSSQILEAIKNGAKPFKVDEEGRTSLMYAAYSNPNIDVIKTLLNIGLPIHGKDIYGREAIIYSILNNPNTEVTNVLMKSGSNVFFRSDYGENALMLAASSNQNPDMIKFLVECGVKLSERSRMSQSSLMYASAMNNNPEVIKYLVKIGENINEKDSSGLTPIMYAAQSNKNIEIINTLINLGAKVDVIQEEKIGDTVVSIENPITLAVKYNTPKVAELLIKRISFNINERVNDLTLIHCAAGYNSDVGMTKMLLELGANRGKQTSDGITAFMIASGMNSNVAVVSELFNEYEINLKSDDGKTPLIYAAMYNQNEEIVKYLLNNKADIGIYDSKNLNALMYASISNKNDKVIKLLIESGADVSEKYKGSKNNGVFWLKDSMLGSIAYPKGVVPGDTPLSMAAYSNTVQVVRCILSYNINIDECNESGKTALMMAASKNEDPAVVKILLDAGASITKKDKSGKTAYDYAKDNINMTTEVLNRLK